MGLLLSEKYKAFIKCNADVEFLEGTTYAGKTTVGIFKFMLKVAESPKKLHIIAAKDTGTAEKNIINKDLGIVDVFGSDLADYNGLGTSSEKIPHIAYHTNGGDKIIYILGYDDKKKWKKALGGQYGCLYVDEINTADMDFVREAAMRCDYLIATLNPDDPALPIYNEYINKSRPLDKWIHETPKEILAELNEAPNDNWVHWFFSFDHNLGLSEKKLQQIKTNVPQGTKQYKNKIEGIRCRATGLVFSNFTYERNVVGEKWVLEQLERRKYSNSAATYKNGRRIETDGFKFTLFTAGMDTSYSKESEDTIAMMFYGITDTGICILLDINTFNNKGRPEDKQLGPSDVCELYIDFLERNREKWGFARFAWIDSADQATIREMAKLTAKTGSVYTFGGSHKKMKIISRIALQRQWIQDGDYLVLDHCKEHIDELNKYSYEGETGKPEDRNDHTINAGQYAWLPWVSKIGANAK